MAAALLTCTAASPDNEFDRAARLATEARELGNVSQAIDLYQKALHLKQNWEEGWFYLGTLYYSTDHRQEAIDAFRFVLDRHPTNGAAWAFTGLSEFELRDYGAALSALQKARSFGVGDNAQLIAVTRYTLAILLNRYSRFDDARHELEALARQGREDTGIADALGMSVLLLPYLPSELPAGKHELVTLAGRAAFQSAANQRQQAAKGYQEMVSRHPDTPNAHYAFGVFLLADRPDEAVAELRRELEISPAHIAARLQLAGEFLHRSDYKAALTLAREAVELAPEAPIPHQMLGRSLMETGELEDAINELELSARLQPEDPQTHFQLARAYRQAKRELDAARENAEFLRLNRAEPNTQYGSQAVGGTRPKPE